ncbi:MAG: YgiQ family radical SAM protein [Candidatus Aminicenantes bacterium]|nr:YgiQ family radical SAM protein [Candidatus Aminicenantes bacterium]
MIATEGTGFDIILVSGEPYADHPLSPVGMIARVLDTEGYKIGVIECPDWKVKEDFLKLGRPRLFFGITSGSIDSMLVNYTPLKRERAVDPNAPFQSRMPDRAVIVYANRIRELHKGARIVLGGIEASLRRFAHYDYWGDDVRRSILLDTRADILVYGPGELQVVEIARRLDRGEGLDGIRGTCVMRAEAPEKALVIPSFEEVKADKDKFCEAQKRLSNRRVIAQKHANRFVVQYPAPDYTPVDLDRVYGLPFTRRIPEGFPELGMARFSVQTHRGCVGRCSFCALSLHQGDRIVSRGEDSILEEIRRMTKHPEWRGFVDDLGGPTANMYGMDTAVAEICSEGDTVGKPNGTGPGKKQGRRNIVEEAHRRLVGLMRAARKVHGVKKVFVRSGIRYDLALESPEYVRELTKHHVSGLLKIAPEHVSENVLRLMNKSGGRRRLEEFRRMFAEMTVGEGPRGSGKRGGATRRGRLAGRPQHLKYYFMVAHPGTTEKEARELAAFLKELEESGEKPVEGVQIFTPTPMTRSTCMYHTGKDPQTGESVYVPRPYAEKKAQKRMLGAASDTD